MTGKSKSFGEVFDAHTAAEFQTRDIEATMATMGETPHVTHVPVMTGGHGADAVRSFYETWFIGHWPEDAKITLVSRTVGDAGRTLLREAADALGLCAHGYHRTLRVARTLAELDDQTKVARIHIAEALSYRGETLRRAQAAA